MATVTTSEFVKMTSALDAPPFSLLEQKGLFARLGEEIARASREIARDPRGFVRELFADDTKDAKRRRKLYFGLAGALVGHIVLLVLIAFIGWHHLTAPKEVNDRVDNWLPSSTKLAEKSPDKSKPEAPKVDVPHGGINTGGGGGGNHNPLPAIRGVPPRMLDAPQVVGFTPPTVPEPALPVQPTVVGPDSPPPPPDATIGDPNGKGKVFSNGPGSGGGIGEGNGSGIGNTTGPGSPGKGNNGSRGGPGSPGSPEGTTPPTGPIPFNRLKELGGSGIVWIHRPTPVTTPEAQKQKVNGEVLLRATFRADGTITDIEVIREVPFMTESAVESLRRSRFRPATIKGQPVTLTNVLVRVNVTADGH
jgi:hypothetical protein